MNDANNTEQTSDYARFLASLKSLRVPHLADNIEELMQSPPDRPVDVWSVLAECAQNEVDRRKSNRYARSLREANIRYPGATLDEHIHDPQRQLDVSTINLLADGQWVQKGKNVLITGLTGAGKSYLASALSVAVISHDMRVLYAPARRFLDELNTYAESSRLHARVDELTKIHLLVLDDFGMDPLDVNACRNLFEVISARDGCGSTMIVSQLPVADWYELFASNIHADAILDRLTQRAYRLTMTGPSMRQRDLS